MTQNQTTESHTIAVLVDNEAGVLGRVIGLFSGRGYNIESLTVSEVDHHERLSRINIVTTGTPMVIEQIKAQLGRLVPVHRVRDLTADGPSVQRELALVKVVSSGDRRVEILAHRRYLPRPRGGFHQRVLRLRDRRQDRQARRLHPPHGAPGADRYVADRRRRHCPGDGLALKGGRSSPLRVPQKLPIESKGAFRCASTMTAMPTLI